MVTASPQPCSATLMNAYTRAVMPAVEARAPDRSKRPSWRSVSLTKRGASSSTAPPTGMLTKNTHLQEVVSVSRPPAMSPTVAPAPATAE